MNKLPPGWQIKSLGDIANFINGRAFKPAEWNIKGLPIIRIQNLTSPDSVYNYFDGKIEDRYIVKKNDILISWSASLDVYIWNYENAVLNQHIFKVELDNSIDRIFFFYLIKTKIAEMLDNVHGSTMKHITKDRFENIQVALPSLLIQKQIAEILEKADQAKQKRKEANKLTEQFLQSAFIEMFGDPVNNPKGWEKNNLDDLVDYFQYGTSVKSTEEGILVLRIPNIIQGTIDLTNLKSVQLSINEQKSLLLNKGDILFVRTNGNPDFVGRCALFNLELKCVFASYLIRAIIKQKIINPTFLVYLLGNANYRNVVRSKCSTTAGQFNINTKGLGWLPIIAPPLLLQQQFADLVQKTEALKEKQKKSETELENLFNTLMQKAFKGELVS